MAGLCRGDRRGGDGPARLDHHAGRRAGHPPRPRRLLRRHRVGDRRLRPGPGGGAADRRPLGDLFGLAVDAADRDGRVRGRLGAVRRGRQRGPAHRGPGGAGRAGRDHAAPGVRADQGSVRGARDGPGVRRLRAGDGPVGHARSDRVRRADRRRRPRRGLADDLPGERAGRAPRAGARRATAPRGRAAVRLAAARAAGPARRGAGRRGHVRPGFPAGAGARAGLAAWLYIMLAASVLALACFAAYQVRRAARGPYAARRAVHLRAPSLPGRHSCSRSCSSARWAGS